MAAGQHPFAVLLGCADSRVASEPVFDQGIGDLFDERVAGNIVDELLLGSMEYAVEESAPPLVVVLGHERCGAVSATLSAGGRGARPQRDRARAGGGRRAGGRRPARWWAEAGALAVVGAHYDLDTARVTLVD